MAALDTAEEYADNGMLTRVSSQLHQNLEITGKLLGDLNVGGGTTINNVLVMPAYVEMRIELVKALEAYPEARIAVAQVLHRIEFDSAKQIEGESRELAR